MSETRSGRATPIDTNEFDVISVIKEKFDKLKADPHSSNPPPPLFKGGNRLSQNWPKGVGFNFLFLIRGGIEKRGGMV